MMLRLFQLIAVSVAVYYGFPIAFAWTVDPVQAVAITMFTYLFGLIIAQPQEPVSIAVVKTKEDDE